MNNIKHHLAEISAALPLSDDNFRNTTPIFITAFGFVEGTLVVSTENETNPTIKTYYKFYRDALIKNECKDLPFIFLKNVQITTSLNLKYKLQFLLLYPEEIIGISLSNPTVPLFDLESPQPLLPE